MSKIFRCLSLLVFLGGCSDLFYSPDPVVCPPPKVIVVPKIVAKAVSVSVPDPHAPVYITPLGLPKPTK